MTTNKKTTNNQINSNTQIIFTVKSFFATIGTLLGILFGFYQLVIVPKVDTVVNHYQEMFKDQKEQNRIFYEKFSNLENSVGAVNESIKTLNGMFKDLENSLQTNVNSNGSFGNGNTDRILKHNDIDSISLASK